METAFDPDSVSAFVGTDSEGTPCVYFQILNDDSEHVRYLTEDEILKFASSLLNL